MVAGTELAMTVELMVAMVGGDGLVTGVAEMALVALVSVAAEEVLLYLQGCAAAREA